MQATLVIFLHAHDLSRPSWAVVDADAKLIKLIESGDPSELSAEAKDRSVTVIVPAEDVLLTTATLPKMNRARLLQAIPFALEEQIIEDVEIMHFAAGKQQVDEPLPVNVVSRTKMTEWMTLLQSFNIVPDVVMSSIFALPTTKDEWIAVINEVAVVRTGSANGFACDRINFAEMLSLALATAVSPPNKISINNAHGSPLNLTISVPVEERAVTSLEVMEMMARQAVFEAPVNLLQGDYQNKKTRRMPKMTNLLKVGAYLAITWAALLFLYPVVSFIILNGRASDIKTQVAAIYKKQFPTATSIVAPKERMQQKLNKLASDIGENHLLLMMANIGKALSQASGVQLKRMDFQNNLMTLEISAATSEVFSDFTNALMQQGLHVKQQNANLTGARVSATLEIS
jgi:general secretion pathway protein L